MPSSADAVVEIKCCKIRRSVTEGNRKNLFRAKRQPSTQDFPTSVDNELVVHVPEENVITQKRIARFNRERNAGTPSFRKQIKALVARIMPGEFQPDLAVERNAHFFFPPQGELFEPPFVVAKDIVLHVEHFGGRPPMKCLSCFGYY